MVSQSQPAKVWQPLWSTSSVEKCDASLNWHWHTLVLWPMWPREVSHSQPTKSSTSTLITNVCYVMYNASLGWHQQTLWPRIMSPCTYPLNHSSDKGRHPPKMNFIEQMCPFQSCLSIITIVELHWPHVMPLYALRSTVMCPTSDLDWCHMSHPPPWASAQCVNPVPSTIS